MPRPCTALGQGVFDRFCQDMDDNLREMGVGDLTVPKEMRRMGEAFYGRAQAYRAALAADGDRRRWWQALAAMSIGGSPAAGGGARGLPPICADALRDLTAQDAGGAGRRRAALSGSGGNIRCD